MAGNCYDNKLLLRDGVSQSQRLLNTLLPDYAKVDEREPQDLVLFAKKYGFYLNYFDLTNSISGDWQGLMSKDPAVIIASVSDWPAKDFSVYLQNLFAQIKNSATEQEAKQNFTFIFSFIFSIAANIDAALKSLSDDTSYTEYLYVSIRSSLKPPLSLLWNYYNYPSFQALIDNTSTLPDSKMPVNPIISSGVFDPLQLSAAWWEDKNDATSSLSIIDAPAITSIDSTTIQDQIGQLITHKLFTGPLDAFIDAVSNIIEHSPDFLTEVMEKYPSHSPHYALFLGFIRLFRLAQDHQNEYTKNHLDFYYNEVLQLKNKVADPDFVHLVFELQKNTESLILSKDTLFKAGKDKNKNDLYYGLTDNVTIQKAVIKAVRSLYLSKKTNASSSNLLASPQANTEDGLGAKLLSPNKSWYAFGNPYKAAAAQIGFAISSNLLYLNEGERTIVFTIKGESFAVIDAMTVTDVFTISFTGNKKWIDVTDGDYIDKMGSLFTITATSISICIKLKASAPSLVPYSKKIHGGTYPQELPMIKLILKEGRGDVYQKIKSINAVNFIIDVSVNAIKNLSVQNDNGKIDLSKPFKPFGEFPAANASFIIGSKEIFQKPLTGLNLNFAWQGNAPTDKVIPYYLKGGKWIDNTEQVLSTAEIPMLDKSKIDSIPPVSPTDFSNNDTYKPSSVDGFVRICLKGDQYSMNSYLAESKTVTVTKSDTNYTVTPVTTTPVSPASPTAISVGVSYQAQDVLFTDEVIAIFNNPLLSEQAVELLKKRKHFFYHIEPFGFREMHPLLLGKPVISLPQLPDDNLFNLLPVFNLDSGIYTSEDTGAADSTDNGGELWIGLDQMIIGQALSILIQVADGTANPLKNNSEINWYYLSQNNWVPFEPNNIVDYTNSLTTSALVSLLLPPAANDNNTRADAGLYWVKLVAKRDTDAVCRLINIHANAAKASFVQNADKGITYLQPIAGETISKPLIANASIKKIEQPYPSFDGAPQETDDTYYTRVSERLRHKKRAVTAWDYERIVLDKFPSIYKVKCLNHTGYIFDRKKNTNKYSEVLAGHVMVIIIPDITKMSSQNRLLPYTSLGMLKQIQDYLYTYTSPHVQLHVCNPVFEQVQFDFTVNYRDTNNYNELLNNSIEEFLSPWSSATVLDGNTISFGGKIEKSVVLNFIENQPYVDFVSCFKMFQYEILENDEVKKTEVEETSPSSARSIFVSYYDEELNIKHIINSTDQCECNG